MKLPEIKYTKAQQKNALIWAEALESGEYEQGQGTLCRTIESGENYFCCLGVATDVLVDGDWKEHHWGEWFFPGSNCITIFPSNKARNLLGLSVDDLDKFMIWNDNEFTKFNTIAKRIRKMYNLPPKK